MRLKIRRAFFLRPEIILLLIFNTYCSAPTEKGVNNEEVAKKKKERVHNTTIKSPKTDDIFTVSDVIEFKLTLKDKSLIPDSILLFNGNDKIATLEKSTFEYSWNSSSSRVGRLPIRSVSYYGDSISESNSVFVTLLSDIAPKNINYEVIAKYPHDSEAFTQGLVYNDGFFYEGTGQYKESTLRKVDIKTGKVINILDIGDEYFGEGIAIYKDKIFQLTWKSQVGFIYDKETFTLIQKIYYDPKEGWGLTYNGDKFIFSDGSAKLYFIEPEYFTESSQIEVYDNKGMVSYLNELEYIDGYVYANIWGDKKIAIIDPTNGKIVAYLDMARIISDEIMNRGDKVLNGIAYNPENNHLYITGKNWPTMFEIKLTDPIR